MRGVVRWYHPELQMALIELGNGFAVGAVEEGDCMIGDALEGHFRQDEVENLHNQRTGMPLLMLVEEERVSEEQANDLLGLMGD